MQPGSAMPTPIQAFAGSVVAPGAAVTVSPENEPSVATIGSIVGAIRFGAE